MRTPTCRRCMMKDGSGTRAQDVICESISNLPRSGKVLYWLRCRRCGWGWWRERIPADFPGLAESLERNQTRALAIPDSIPVLPDLSNKNQYQQVFESALRLPGDQLAGLLLALSAAVADRIRR